MLNSCILSWLFNSDDFDCSWFDWLIDFGGDCFNCKMLIHPSLFAEFSLKLLSIKNPCKLFLLKLRFHIYQEMKLRMYTLFIHWKLTTQESMKKPAEAKPWYIMCKLYLLLLLYKTLSHKISGTKIICCGCKKFHILGEIRLFLFIAFGYDLGLIPMHYSSACDQIN